MNSYLIVVDMQKDFVDGSLGSKEAQAIVENVTRKIENWQGPIVVTRDTHGSDYLLTREGKYLPVEHCIVDTEGWQIDQRVQAALEKKDDVTYIDNPTYGSVELVDWIAKRQGYAKEDRAQARDMEIELIGLCTDICVVSNAMLLKAAYPEVNLSVDASCCAGVTPESHEAALTTMKCCQIDIH